MSDTQEVVIKISDERFIQIAQMLTKDKEELLKLKNVEKSKEFDALFLNLQINPHYFYLYEEFNSFFEVFAAIQDRYYSENP